MNRQDMAAQDRAAMEQTAPVTADAIFQAVANADRFGNGVFGELYGYVRDRVVHFAQRYAAAGAAPSKLDSALAELCQPLIDYARYLDAIHAQATVHGSDVRGRFADVHALGESASRRFVEALKAADPGAYVPYVRFIAGTTSESALESELSQHVRNPDRLGLLIAGASALKDGMQATHTALSAGATEINEVKPVT